MKTAHGGRRTTSSMTKDAEAAFGAEHKRDIGRARWCIRRVSQLEENAIESGEGVSEDSVSEDEVDEAMYAWPPSDDSAEYDVEDDGAHWDDMVQ